MRLIAPLLALLLAAPVARAIPPTVNEFTRTVNTGPLRVRFDELNPDKLASVELVPLGNENLAGADLGGAAEFFGQTYRDRNAAGFVDQDLFLAANWVAWTANDSEVVVRAETWTDAQPPVRTDWTFRTGSAQVLVERTLYFSLVPDTSAYQPFVVRMAPLTAYRALRWRDSDGNSRSGSFCWDPCVGTSWDGRWLEFTAREGAGGYSVALAPASVNPGHAGFVRGMGVLSYGAAFGLLRGSGPRDRDETHRYVLAFSAAAQTDDATLDSLQSTLDRSLPPLGAPSRPRATLTLSATPNPSRGDVHLAWSTTEPGDATLDVFDVSGRRVARLHEARVAAGAHVSRWDGRTSSGRAAAPGVYTAVLRTATGVATRTIALTR